MEQLITAGLVLALCGAALFTLFKMALPASYDEGYQYGVSMVSHPEARAEAEALLKDSEGDFAHGLRDALKDFPVGLPNDVVRDHE